MPSVSWYSPSGNAYLDGLLNGTKWAVTSLTFSFPTDPSFYGSNYGSGEPSNNFEAFNPAQRTATRIILQSFAAVTNLNFTEVTETATQHGDLRFAETDSTS